MNNASLNTPTFKMLAVGLSFACSLAYADTEGYLSTSSAAGYSEVGPAAVYAGQTQAGITAREAARRQAEQKAAQNLLQEGRSAYSEGRYTEALEKYRQAWDRVPHAPATQRLQEFIRSSISDASIAVAMEYAKVGRYDDAEQLLLDVLKRDPNNARARKELSLLRDPIRNNPALTPEHVKDVDEVQRLLNLAWGYYELGKYNEADAEFNNVLKIDPYNEAARRGQAAVQQRRSNYYSVTHDTYRSKALAEVVSMWEAAMPNYVELTHQGGGRSSSGDVISDTQIKISQQLDALRIPRVSLDGTPVSDVVEFLRGEIRRAGDQLNINFVKRKDTPAPAAPVAAASSDDDDDDSDDEESAPSAPVAVAAPVDADPTVDINSENITIREILDEVHRQTGCVYVVRDNGVYLYTKGDPNAVVLQTRTFYEVPKSYLTGGSGGEDDGEEDDDDAFASAKSSSKRFDPMAALKANAGVDFSAQGSKATYNPNLQQLIVTNTPENLEAIEELIRDSREKSDKMVKITTKFVEVTQANDEELSFDWVINPFSVSNNGSTYLGGGTASGGTPTRTYDDFVTSGGSAYSNYHKNSGSWPIRNNSTYASDSDPLTQGLVTAGNRTGSGAISASSMDSLVASGSPTTSANSIPAPGILSLTGIYDTGSFQMIMRGLSQKRGVDVMSAPSLVMTPGEENAPAEGPMDTRLDAPIQLDGSARIEVVRRFVFPTAYDAPQIPENNYGGGNNSRSSSVPVAAPSNPSDWGVEEVGLVMTVAIKDIPIDNVIKFSGFIVRVVDFEGFINYGSPIISGVANQTQIETIVLTENRIDQPVFSRKMVNTTLSLYDGYTVAIGGMIEDRVQKVEDKVPVFGDLPFIGRFFRSNAESHTRKNLTIFVTADIIDPTGKPARSRSDSQSAGSASAPGLFPDDGLLN